MKLTFCMLSLSCKFSKSSTNKNLLPSSSMYQKSHFYSIFIIDDHPNILIHLRKFDF